MSGETLDYWAPRQLLDYGLLPVGLLSDAGIEGITDEGSHLDKRFFRLSPATPGHQPPCAPNWNIGSAAWLNSIGASMPVTYVGNSEDGAASNTTDLTCKISVGSKQVICLTELESPTGGSYIMPAGDWTIRFLRRGADYTPIYLSGTQIVLVDQFTSGSKTYYGTDGASSTVHHTHTPSPLTLMGSNGTYSMSFTTSSSVTVGATQKLVVLTYVTNGNRRFPSTVTFRHNRNLLTPWLTRTISLDPVNVGLAAGPVSNLALVLGAAKANVAVAARAAATLVSIAASVPGIVTAAKPATTSKTVAAGPAAVAVAAVAVTAVGAPREYITACIVASASVDRELIATGHHAARAMQTPTLGRAYMQAPSTRPGSPRAAGCRFRAASPSLGGKKVALAQLANRHGSQAAATRSLVSAPREVRQRSAVGESTQAVPNSGGPTLSKPSGVC
jgi:hypothetical protein